MDEAWWNVSLEEEYQRNPDINPSDVAAIQDWRALRPHLPPLPDHIILIFLVACNNNLIIAKKTIELNYTMRTKLPSIFSNRDPLGKRIVENMAYADMALLDSRDPSNNIVMIYKLHQIDLAKYNFVTLAKLGFMTHDLSHLEKGSAPGYVFIVDLAYLSIGYLLKSPVNLVAQSIKYAQEASSCSIKAIHVINAGILFDRIMSFIKPFVQTRVAKMIIKHPTFESLQQCVPKNCLPSEYGGHLPSLSELHGQTMERLKSCRRWFIEEEAFRVDDSKRSVVVAPTNIPNTCTSLSSLHN